MKSSTLKALAAISAAGLLTTLAHATSFPTIGLDTAPDVIINWDGTTATISYNQNNGPFDGIEDTYVGVINSSANSTLNSIYLTGSNIFGFDGDTGYSFGPTGYEGYTTTFSVVDSNSGNVNFTGGLQAGDTAWFLLEENITGANGSGITVAPTAVPDASSTLALLGSALFGLAFFRRRLAR